MGVIAVKIKIMPDSPEADLEEIKANSKRVIEENGGKNPNFNEEPIAFGLKAIIVLFAWPEEKPLEDLEKSLEKIENVKSVNVLDIRRAFG